VILQWKLGRRDLSFTYHDLFCRFKPLGATREHQRRYPKTDNSKSLPAGSSKASGLKISRGQLIFSLPLRIDCCVGFPPLNPLWQLLPSVGTAIANFGGYLPSEPTNQHISPIVLKTKEPGKKFRFRPPEKRPGQILQTHIHRYSFGDCGGQVPSKVCCAGDRWTTSENHQQPHVR